MRAYEYRHVVAFEETNLVGNVYFANHVRWQGRCREMFLRDHCPELLEEMENGLAFVTLRCSCEYLSELKAFDVISVRMQADRPVQNRLTMHFSYWRLAGSSGPVDELVAKGEHQIASFQRLRDELRPVSLPPSLSRAVEPYLRG